MSRQRLRLFAGPNGSGKSTINTVIPTNLLGYYLNPDEIEKEVKSCGYYDVRSLNLTTTQEEIVHFFGIHPLLKRIAEADSVQDIRFVQNEFISFARIGFNAYLSAILADFLRQQFIRRRESFTFESVMSSPDKLDTLAQASSFGYRTYLYYVATEDPLINLSRIRHRVRTGGHAVPEKKVIERYYRSLDLLLDAIRLSDRAYIFDNSGESKIWVAEITNGSTLDLKTDKVPAWVKRYILDKL